MHVANLAKGTQAAAAGMQNVANNAAKAQSAFTGTGRAAAQSARELELWAKNAAKIEQMQIAMLNKQEAKKQLQQQGLIPGPTEKPGLLSRGTNLLGTWIMGAMGVHAADKLITRAGEVDALKNRMHMALGNREEVEHAYDKAFALSGKYQNTTVAENLKIIDDLRANLPEKMHHVIDESTEPFVKLHSFFKSLDGGKHAGNSHAALKDIGAAIRSGELIGQMTGADLAAHAQAIATARIQFGDKFKVTEYFQATQKAMVPLTAANETFKHVDFPMMVQRMGINAGVAINSLNQKLVGGIRLKGAADAWERAGMLDPEFVRTKLMRNKDGSINSKSLIGQKWIAGSDEMAQNPLDWSVNRLIPGLERLGSEGVDAKGIQQAWKAGDFEKLTGLIKQIKRTDMTRLLSGLGYDQNSVRALEALVVDLPSALRDRQGVQRAIKDTEVYDSYEKSKQRLAAQAERFWISLAGKEFVPWVTDSLNKVAGAFGRASEIMKDNPVARQAVKWGAAAAGILAVTAALRGLARISGLTAVASGLARIAMSSRMLKFGAVGLAGFGLYELYQNWDKVKQYIANPIKLTFLWPEMPEWLKKTVEGAQSIANAIRGGTPEDGAFAERINRSNYNTNSWYQPSNWKTNLDAEMARENARGNAWGNVANGNSPGNQASASNAAAQRVMVESTVRTTIDPIQVQAPSSIEVRVTGTVNGQVNGTGSIPITTSSPRGQSAADPIAPKVSN